MHRLIVDPDAPEPRHIATAVEVLRAGGLVVLPTETVYGLGGLADDPETVARIFRAKGRPADNPLIAHVAGEGAARALAAPGAWTPQCEALARLWPGPVTLVVNRAPGTGAGRVCAEACAGRPTVAIRVPDHPVTLAVLRALDGRPVAAPSANPSERLSPVAAEHVLAGLGNAADLLLEDPRACRLGIESTVIDCSRTAEGEPPVVLRPGSADPEDLQRLVPDLQWQAEAGRDRAAPGHRARHYAPAVPMHLLERSALPAAVDRCGGRCAVVHRDGALDLPQAVEQVQLPDAPLRFGARLYATLHALEAAGVERILMERVPAERAWAAVADRLARGATPWVDSQGNDG